MPQLWMERMLGFHETRIIGANLTDEETLLHEATQHLVLAMAGCSTEHSLITELNAGSQTIRIWHGWRADQEPNPESAFEIGLEELKSEPVVLIGRLVEQIKRIHEYEGAR